MKYPAGSLPENKVLGSTGSSLASFLAVFPGVVTRHLIFQFYWQQTPGNSDARKARGSIMIKSF